MTLDEAIQRFRELHWSAREEWPSGVPADLGAQAEEALTAITLHLDTLPEAERSAEGQRIRDRIEARAHVATVPRKTSRSRRPGQAPEGWR